MLIANFSANTVFVLAGNGDGTFHLETDLPTSSGPNGFAVGDFNGDAIDDFAIGNFNDIKVTVYLGNPEGFLQAADVPVGAGPANTTAVADFNNDGKLDLATSNYNDGTVSVIFGNGDGTFQAPVTSCRTRRDRDRPRGLHGQRQRGPRHGQLCRQHHQHPAQ